MARRLDHNRYTVLGKLRVNFGMLLGGIGILPVAKLLCATKTGAVFGAPLFVAGPILIAVAVFGIAIALLEGHREVRCPSCGHLYRVEWGVHSFLCTSCGARVGSIPSGYEQDR